ncbi:hypothetical protein [Streptomyces sp. cmx-4-9]
MSGRGAAACQTGAQALMQYLEREVVGLLGRGHVERLSDSDRTRARD